MRYVQRGNRPQKKVHRGPSRLGDGMKPNHQARAIDIMDLRRDMRLEHVIDKDDPATEESE